MDEINLNKYEDRAERVYDYMYANYSHIFDEDEIYHAIKEAKKEEAWQNSKKLLQLSKKVHENNN